jgi:hypothetical protein
LVLLLLDSGKFGEVASCAAPSRCRPWFEFDAGNRVTPSGTPTHSFFTLLDELGTIVRDTCRTPDAGPDAPTFDVTTISNPKQQRAIKSIQA